MSTINWLSIGEGQKYPMGYNKAICFVTAILPEYKKEIEVLYTGNRIFKEVCDHYSLCFKALECWKRSGKKEAAARRIEYEQLLRRLEEEIQQYLIEGDDTVH